jgi:hypothetical protein
MDYAPCRSLAADAVYFEIGVLAYNLMTAVKRPLLGGDWVKRTIASLRWRLLETAGKVVCHAASSSCGSRRVTSSCSRMFERN